MVPHAPCCRSLPMNLKFGHCLGHNAHHAAARAAAPPENVCIKLKMYALNTRMSMIGSPEKKYTSLHGLKDLIEPPHYKPFMQVWLLDQFGVLHDGQKAYPGAMETLDRITNTGVKLVIISNSSRRAKSTVQRMESLGFDPSVFAGIITSGELTHDYLKRRDDPWFARLGHKCVHIRWRERSSISLEGLGLEIVEDPEIADFILAHGTEALGLSDGGVKPATLEELEAVLARAAGRRIPMVVANPDHVTVEARDLKIMPGSLGLQYEKLGGHVQYMGKPDSVVYQAAANMTGASFSEMVAVGDSLFHDIQGAAQNYIDSVFVAGGIHAHELGINDVGLIPEPDKVECLLKRENVYPSFVVPSFTL